MLQPEEQIQQLKRDNQLPEALALCEKWMGRTEREARGDNVPVESWPYLQACIILRKLKRPVDEVAVIERFIQQPDSGSKQSKSIVERLSKAYDLAGMTEMRVVDGQRVTFYSAEGVPVDERQMFVRDAVIVDCETTGLGRDDEVIELALLRFRYSSLSGRILQEVGRYTGLSEPSHPISAAAAKVHGLTMQDVAGQRIDTASVGRLLEGVDVAIAHNATFDRRMVAPLFPQLAEVPWYCSLRSIAWTEKGCASSKLHDIAAFYGANVAHRAMSDVQTIFDLMATTDGQTGKTILYELLEGTPLDYVSRWQAAHDHDDDDDDGYTDSIEIVISMAPSPAKVTPMPAIESRRSEYTADTAPPRSGGGLIPWWGWALVMALGVVALYLMVSIG